MTSPDKDDPDSLGCFVQYRVAWYIAGDTIDAVVNFFMLFDGYLQYKAKQFARATPFEVDIYPYVGVDLASLQDSMNYKPITLQDPRKDLPLKIFQAQPVVGKRVLTFFFEPESGSEVSLVITGNTWNYRDDLEKNGISGARGQQEVGGQYYRFVKNVDVSSLEGRQQILALIDIFNKQAIRVVVDPEPEEDSDVAKFVEDLREQSCLHFA